MDDFEAAFPYVEVEQTGFQSSPHDYVPRLLAGDWCTKGSGFNTGPTPRLRTHDDEIIRNIYKDQEAFLSTDARQLKNLQDNSRRSDVPTFDRDTPLQKGEDFTLLDAE